MFARHARQFGIASAIFAVLITAIAAARAGTLAAGNGIAHQKYSTLIAEGAPASISLEIPGVDTQMVSIGPSSDGRAFLEMDIFGADADQTRAYSVNVTGNESGTMTVSSNDSNYSCQYHAVNGVIQTLSGLCITGVRILLPTAPGVDTLVLVNHTPAFGSVHSVPELLSLLQNASFPQDKETLLESFISGAKKRGQKRFVSVADTIKIMQSFGSFDALKVAQALSGSVTDPQNAAQARDSVFGPDQDEAIQALSR